MDDIEILETEIIKHLDTIKALKQRLEAAEAWARVWKACARRYHDRANIAICSYCGHESPKDKNAMIDHMSMCEKRPDREDWETLRDAMAINAIIGAAEARVTELERRIKEFEDSTTLEELQAWLSDD